jgi:hypothetical protein
MAPIGKTRIGSNRILVVVVVVVVAVADDKPLRALNSKTTTAFDDQ